MLTPREQLLTGHDEFQRLAQEHSQYSQRLESLTQKRYLTDDEKLEEVRLKKLKLRLKDQMLTLEQQVSTAVCVDVDEQARAIGPESAKKTLDCTPAMPSHRALLSAFFY